MRFLYNLLTYLLLIPFAIYWLVKGIGNRNYFDRLQQRFGFGFPDIDNCIWVHAVSVGEVQAAVPLIRSLLNRFPEQTVLITTVTPTGAARVNASFGDSVKHCYIPFEFPNAISSFFASVDPQAAMIMETEIWPNLYRGCGVRGIPLILVSARISPRSRFGFGFPDIDNCIWVHAVSVGEVQAAVPLIRSLLNRFPEQTVLITTVTPTGAARVNASFGDSVKHCYIPFEFPNAISSFFASVDPQAAMIMETEIWPNLYRGCGVRGIPLILVSARISPRSIPGYRRLLPLIRETLSHGIIIAAQSQADADRFLELGASPVRTQVTGNIKFDIEPDPAIAIKGEQLRKELFGSRPVWIAASTHEGEEQQVLDAHRCLLEQHPDLLLVLIPRHPERFQSVREIIDKQSFNLVSRSDNRRCNDSTEVLLVDTMGEVPLFYAASDIAFVGGSLVPVGGHNLLEPAALGLPIITGNHVFNTQDVVDKFVELGACLIVASSSELAATILRLIMDPAEARQLGENGLRVLEQNRGALQRLLILLEPLLVKKDSA